MNLRPFQQQGKDEIKAAWKAGYQNVIYALPTGGGKTVTLASIVHDHIGLSCVIAHRSELVGQISLALAREGVVHRIFAPANVIRAIVAEHIIELGRSYFHPNAQCAVAGVNTLDSRQEQLRAWMLQVTLWVIDEAHHVLRSNVWGRAVAMFPNACGLGVSATIVRPDGNGLGRHAQGVFDKIVEGPAMRYLIEEGYLTDYVLACPETKIDMSEVPVTASGDFSQKKLAKAVHDSKIVGDVVTHYMRAGGDKLAVVFNTDVETATDMARQFQLENINAEVVSSKTPNQLRVQLIRSFRQGKLKVLSSVDIFSEGFDLPAIQVGHFGRPTESFVIFAQQFGRTLRPFYVKGMPLETRAQRLESIARSEKPHAFVFDHVGNTIRHGLPDAPRIWSLDARERKPRHKNDDDAIPLRICVKCTKPYERFRVVCPYCEHPVEPSSRSSPEFVDGDLYYLDAETLAKMRGEIAHVDSDSNGTAIRMQYAGASQVAINSMMKSHRERKDAQEALRFSITWWSGLQRKLGFTDREIYKRFYLIFNVDIMSAQALGKSDALTLAERINNHFGAKLNESA